MLTILGKVPNNDWEIPNFDESMGYKFIEDTYDVMSCMQDGNACLGCYRGIM